MPTTEKYGRPPIGDRSTRHVLDTSEERSIRAVAAPGAPSSLVGRGRFQLGGSRLAVGGETAINNFILLELQVFIFAFVIFTRGSVGLSSRYDRVRAGHDRLPLR